MVIIIIITITKYIIIIIMVIIVKPGGKVVEGSYVAVSGCEAAPPVTLGEIGRLRSAQS